MKILQYSCRESGEIDMRQAKAVLRHKPDVIIFEAPSNTRTASSIFNKFKPNAKPMREFAAIQKRRPPGSPFNALANS